MKSLKRIVVSTLILAALLYGVLKFNQLGVDAKLKKNERCQWDFDYQGIIQRSAAEDIRRHDKAFQNEEESTTRCFKEKIVCISDTYRCVRNYVRARDLEVCAPDSAIKHDYSIGIQELIKINHPKFDPIDCFTSVKEAKDFTANLQFILELKKEQNKVLAHKNCSYSLNQCKKNLENCRFNYKSICKL